MDKNGPVFDWQQLKLDVVGSFGMKTAVIALSATSAEWELGKLSFLSPFICIQADNYLKIWRKKCCKPQAFRHHSSGRIQNFFSVHIETVPI